MHKSTNSTLLYYHSVHMLIFLDISLTVNLCLQVHFSPADNSNSDNVAAAAQQQPQQQQGNGGGGEDRPQIAPPSYSMATTAVMENVNPREDRGEEAEEGGGGGGGWGWWGGLASQDFERVNVVRCASVLLFSRNAQP